MHRLINKSVILPVTIITVFACLLVTGFAPVSALSNAVTLQFTSLPSTQGWVYYDDPISSLSKPESAIFSIVGNALHMDSRFGSGTDGAWGYKYALPVDTDAPFTITVDARVTATDRWSPAAFSIYAISNDQYYGFGFNTGPDTVIVGTDTSVPVSFDVTQYHQYQLRAIPGTGVDLYVDGTFLASGTTFASAGAPFIYIGDGTRGGSAVADITSFYYEPTNSCNIDAPPSVNEGTNFTATVQCHNVTGAYGFQLGTSSSGDASTSATSYTPGSFVTDAGSDYLEGGNSLSAYLLSRRDPAAEANGDFSLGSLPFSASSGLTADGSATLSLDTLLLGDISGAPLSLSLADTTTVTVIDLLTLNLTVASDGSVQQVRDVTASADSESRGPQTASGTSLTLNFTDVLPTSTPVLTADMKSHLECSGPLSLTTSVTDQTIHLKAGDVVLNGADASARINIFDAVTIGLSFGTAGSGEEDVNGDGTVNIFDLIHVGRNYGAVTGSCA